MTVSPIASGDARVVSVNVGAVREIEWRGDLITTAIWKHPVAGRVALRGVNLAGDDQADRTVHGGPDKAVYAYALEDYEFWRKSAGLNAEAGLFGENLTVSGLDLSSALVGERWRVGTTLLEVAQPRLPCFKLGIRVGDTRFLRKFLDAGRAGAYLRIIEEGEVGAGDRVEIVFQPTHDVSLLSMIEVIRDGEHAERLLAAPALPEYWRRVALSR